MSQPKTSSEFEAAIALVIAERAALAANCQPGAWVEEYWALTEAIAELQRDWAKAEGREYAKEVDWSPRWSGGAPLPHVLASGHQLFVVYLVHEPDPEWDGTTVSVKDPGSNHDETLAVVSFRGATVHRFGSPNDEVFDGHRLADSGFHGGYGVYEVHDSAWIHELQLINRVHSMYRPDSWPGSRRHFLLAFHDEMMEVIADEMVLLEVRRGSFRAVLREYVDRLVER